MHPPAWICSEIARVDPHLRLAWYGEPPPASEKDAELEGAINCGNFALVYISHIRNCGPYHNPFTNKEFWDVDLVSKQNGAFEWKRANRGPVFNRRGGTVRDYDPLFYHPVLLQVFNHRWGFDGSEVFTGELIPFLKRQVTTKQELRKRRVDSVRQKARKWQADINDKADQAIDRWFYEGSKASETSDHSYAEKHAKEHLKYQRGLQPLLDGKLELEDYFLKKKGLN